MSKDLQSISWGGLWHRQRLDEDGEAEVAEPADVAAGGALGVAPIQVVLAELAIGGVCGEHVIDADKELVSDRQSGAAAAAAALQLVVFGLEEAAALARRGDGSIAQGSLQIRISGSGASRPALAGTLVVGGAGAGPGGEMAGTGED